jgi:hypothetical protein
MHATLFKFLCFLTSGVLILSACNLPSSNATAEPEQSATAKATIELAATQTESTDSQTPNDSY